MLCREEKETIKINISNYRALLNFVGVLRFTRRLSLSLSFTSLLFFTHPSSGETTFVLCRLTSASVGKSLKWKKQEEPVYKM